MTRKEQVEQYVRMRIGRLENRKDESRRKAELAQLRRGIGKTPGEIPELWGVLFEDFPEELMSKNGTPSEAEWAVSTALSLYALHQQGKDGRSMNEEGKDFHLGKAVRKLAPGESDFSEGALSRIRQRFTKFATSKDMRECAHHLRGIVQLLKAEDIPLDYPALAGDLYQFQFLEGAKKVRLRWGEEFYSYKEENGKEEKDDE